MASPKNYEIIKDTKTQKSWNNEMPEHDGGTDVTISKSKKSGKWAVFVNTGYNEKFLGPSKGYSNKNDARKRAVKWMRNNPKGLR